MYQGIRPLLIHINLGGVLKIFPAFEKYRTWVGSKTLSDYQLIWLQREKRDSWRPIPFKFNDNWIKDKEFSDLV